MRLSYIFFHIFIELCSRQLYVHVHVTASTRVIISNKVISKNIVPQKLNFLIKIRYYGYGNLILSRQPNFMK